MRHRTVALTILTLLAFALGLQGPVSAHDPSSPRNLVQAETPTLEQYLTDQALRALEEAGVTPAQDVGASTSILGSPRVVAPELFESVTATDFRCLPTCAVDDGRFLAIAGENLVTLSDPLVDLIIIVDAETSQFELGFFDGDGNALGTTGTTHWDLGLVGVEYRFTLFADPLGDGTGTSVVELEPGSPSVSSFDMLDNGWKSFHVATSPAAQAPSGNFFYRLEIELLSPATTTLNNFKVRAGEALVLQPSSRPFSYYASWSSLEDLQVIYPSFPAVSPTTYDGSFRFFFDVFGSQDSVSVWDGDFDRGKFDGTDLDTDDPNTPGNPFLPPWATPDAKFEGVALGLPGTTGNPADDRNGAGFGAFLLRPPSVVYEVVVPDGRTFFNSNPSGNQEWEEFRVSTEPFDPSTMDASTGDRLPSGAYQLRFWGVDMQNLNAVFLEFPLLCQDEQGAPCEPLRPFLVGDTVFLDLDGDGFQDPGEPGIPGVTVRLLDSAGEELAVTTTDGFGLYQFEVEADTWTVQLAPENFASGGPLEGFVVTTAGDLGTGGTEQTDQVVDDNVLTYDFGVQTGHAGTTGTVGFWKNHPEAWPVDTLVIGGALLTQDELLTLLSAPVRGSAFVALSKQLIAAKLNVFSGADGSCIVETLAAADAWIADFNAGNDPSRKDGLDLAEILDAYNNGELCAPHRG